jgi:hypothetical protein
LSLIGFAFTVDAQSSGSGFIIHSDGYILTNEHVIRNAAKIEVVLPGGKRVPAEVIERDDYKDLALLKVTEPNLQALNIGESRKMTVLDTIVAVGFPFAGLVGNDVSAYDGKINAVREEDKIPLLQVDANVNPGNSGGPVLNDRAEVIGVVVSKLNALALARLSGSIPERINFVIPIDEARGMIRRAYPYGFQPSAKTEKMPVQDVFSAAKQGTVLVLASEQKPTTTEQGTASVPPTNGSTGGGSVPRLESPEAFIARFVKSGEANDPELVAGLFAPECDYTTHGTVSRAFIRREFHDYWLKWPIRNYELLGQPILQPGNTPGGYHVLYQIGFRVSNGLRSIRGTAEYTGFIGRVGDSFLIFYLRERILSRKRS